MEESKHISYFKVENFKRFESFEMENIGQFNLIVGDNNVGKTTVLEALLFDENPNSYIGNMYGALNRRHIQTSTFKAAFNFYFNQKSDSQIISYTFHLNSNSYNLAYEVINKASLTQEEALSIQNKLLTHASQDELIKKYFNSISSFDFTPAGIKRYYSPFVWINSGYDYDLCEFYSSFIQKSNSNKKAFIKDIQLFIPEIWDIEISSTLVVDGNFMLARHIDFDRPFPITMFGDGTIKLLRVLLEIYMCENDRLMIDEIDTGIYHGRFKKFWKTILLAAKRNNVQLFMTTHSQECLKFIKEVLEEDEELKSFQKDMRCFRLVEQKDKSVKSYCYDYEKFQFAINHENEIR